MTDSEEVPMAATSTPTAPLFISLAELADRLGLGYSTVARLAKNGDIPSVEVGGRRLVPVSYLEKLLLDASDDERDGD